MEFVVMFSRSAKGHDATYVIVDQLIKSAYLIPIRINLNMNQFVHLYVGEIVRLHGVPVLIISDRDPWFISRF